MLWCGVEVVGTEKEKLLCIMSSEESDDEPLAVIACLKKQHLSEFPEVEDETTSAPAKKRKKKKSITPASTKLAKISPKLKDIISPPVIQRPEDVWMYLKDFNTNGPYSCLLCSEWFINRSKIIVHYILNHKKDFCGICRFVETYYLTNLLFYHFV